MSSDYTIHYIIRANTEVTEEGRPLFWHNDDGWVELDDAMSFTASERLSLNLPIDSEWCIDHRDHRMITYNTFLWCETCGMEVSGLDIGAADWYDVVGEGTGPRVANG